MPAIFPRLWRYALMLTGNRDSAYDLAQATCLRALEHHAKYAAGTNLAGWLFRMAQNIWCNDLRAAALRRSGGLAEEMDLAATDMSAESNYFLRQVLHTIYALPEAQRACVVLVYVEGFKYAEAAEILTVPVGTVMSRLAAARKTVAARIGDKGDVIQ